MEQTIDTSMYNTGKNSNSDTNMLQILQEAKAINSLQKPAMTGYGSGYNWNALGAGKPYGSSNQ